MKLRSRCAVIGAICISLLLCLVPTFSRAAATVSFDEANKLYERELYAAAAAAYEELLTSGKQSAAVYFNLGNAWFKAGQLGKAIAAYRQASRLAPRDPDLRANLQFARAQRQGPSLTFTRFDWWLETLTINQWTIVAAVGFWGWMLVLGAMQVRPDWKPLLRRANFLLLAVTICVGACLWLAWRNNSRPLGIVIDPEASVRHGPLEESNSAFTVYDGAELEILDRKDRWVQVAAGNRQIGWVPKERLLVL
jgi:tetratricopeptide (TPR) repeat protein